jgi:hypothetical protein
MLRYSIMFKFLKKNNSNKKKKSGLQFRDFDGLSLKENDLVESLRYDLGKCKIIKTDKGLVYQSVKTGRQVHWTKMIDASTSFQKVRKIENKDKKS